MSVPETQPLSQFVRAGAGAGKTWNLTRQVVGRALAHREATGQWPKTILTTFTRKATQELKERLLIYCLQEKSEAVDFVQSSSFLTITTMHGLFNRFLSLHGYALGLASQFQVVEASQADHWRKQILKDLINEKKVPASLSVFDIKRLLQNLKNYEVVYWQQSAKPHSLEDLEKLTQQSCGHIAHELTEIISQASDWVEGEKWDLYFQRLRQGVDELTSEKNWAEKRQSLETMFTGLTKPRKSKNNPGLPKNIDDHLKKLLDDLKRIRTQPEYSEQSWQKLVTCLNDFEQLGQVFMKRLFDKKLKEASLEANDLEFWSLHLLNTKPEVLEKFSEGCDAWFIDEFQDTSPLQLKILEAMIAKKFCYIVGDPQQSIYLFRGSRSEVFFNKQKVMESSGADMQFLQKNYRSQEMLLSFINDFFPLLDKSFSTMEPTKDPEGDGPSTEIWINSTDDREIELKNLTQQIARLLNEGASPQDIAVLARTRKSLEWIQKELTRLGFPVISHASADYYNRREILDALSLLQFLLNPWMDDNLILLLRSPWLGFDDKLILKIIGKEKKNYWPLLKKYFEEHPEHPQGQVLLRASLLARETGVGWAFRKSILSLGMVDFSHKIDSTGRREANLWKLINLVEKVSREPGGSLLKLAREGALATQLEEIGDSSDASSPVEPNKINLMTIHASKGLQFKNVFIPFLNKKPRETTFQDFSFHEEENLWSFRIPVEPGGSFVGGILEKLHVQSMRQREAEESQRLLYVGLTRAESRLFLSWSQKVEKNSWALDFESYLEKGNKDLFKVHEISESDFATYKEAKKKHNISKPFVGEPQHFEMNPISIPLEMKEISQFSDLLESQEKRMQGVVLHRVFESLKHHPKERVLALSEAWLPGKTTEVSKALEYVENHSELPFQAILDNGHVEWGYQLEKAGQLQERRVDLWGVVDKTLWIVDYKTGSPRFKDKAFEQMTAYKVALCEYLNWDKDVKMAAVYPFAQETFILSS